MAKHSWGYDHTAWSNKWTAKWPAGYWEDNRGCTNTSSFATTAVAPSIQEVRIQEWAMKPVCCAANSEKEFSTMGRKLMEIWSTWAHRINLVTSRACGLLTISRVKSPCCWQMKLGTLQRHITRDAHALAKGPARNWKMWACWCRQKAKSEPFLVLWFGLPGQAISEASTRTTNPLIDQVTSWALWLAPSLVQRSPCFPGAIGGQKLWKAILFSTQFWSFLKKLLNRWSCIAAKMPSFVANSAKPDLQNVCIGIDARPKKQMKAICDACKRWRNNERKVSNLGNQVLQIRALSDTRRWWRFDKTRSLGTRRLPHFVARRRNHSLPAWARLERLQYHQSESQSSPCAAHMTWWIRGIPPAHAYVQDAFEYDASVDQAKYRIFVNKAAPKGLAVNNHYIPKKNVERALFSPGATVSVRKRPSASNEDEMEDDSCAPIGEPEQQPPDACETLLKKEGWQRIECGGEGGCGYLTIAQGRALSTQTDMLSPEAARRAAANLRAEVFQHIRKQKIRSLQNIFTRVTQRLAKKPFWGRVNTLQPMWILDRRATTTSP